VKTKSNRLIEESVAPSSSSGHVNSEPFKPGQLENETANFMVTRGQANDQTQFSIKMFIQDGTNKRYKIVVMNPNDNTDYKTLDWPIGT
jgi:hypothetical protein